jgi:hypothetical protein
MVRHWRDRDVQRRRARDAREIGIDCDSGNPREAIAGENQGPRVALFSRDTRIDQDVLELARTPSADRPHAQTWTAKSKPHAKPGFQVRGPGVLTTAAFPDLELRLNCAIRRRNDLHVVAHDTKTPTSG